MMIRTTSISLAFIVISLVSPCSALAPIAFPPFLSSAVGTTPEDTTSSTLVLTRRSVIFGAMVGVGSFSGAAMLPPGVAVATFLSPDAQADKEAAEVAARKELMRERIAASKKNYRKSTDLVKQRKDTTDYSCVADTGSPCPEGLVPRAVQRGIVEALEKKGN
mmetsp:Transcript_46171/g.53398  ORF Transcript_46171/g.53398 Transcript_46171/m.53398 type:complete len:163 (+) Transcript_46171:68-556(+)